MPVEGLTYLSEFLSDEEHHELLAEIEKYPFHEVRMRGQAARRTVIHFGWDYDYSGWKIEPTTPPSPRLRALADRCADTAGVAPESLEQFLVARYPPGATIGWHRDAPMFGSPVVGVSLLSACTMKFRREIRGATEAQTALLPDAETLVRARKQYEQHAVVLEPRSFYILDGAARREWQHSIPPTKSLRYSITMRTLRRRDSSSP